MLGKKHPPRKSQLALHYYCIFLPHGHDQKAKLAFRCDVVMLRTVAVEVSDDGRESLTKCIVYISNQYKVGVYNKLPVALCYCGLEDKSRWIKSCD